MILLKNATIYSPELVGKKDILIGAGKIIKIDENITMPLVESIDLSGKIIMPGFIDQHVHITGGGGEGGFNTRVKESQLSDFTKNGITTVVGLLGTDSVTRSVENLVAKSRALDYEGITCYCLTGSYEFPSPTITGTVKKDIVFIEGLIGAKIAISDHRDSAITYKELARLAQEVRVGAMISGKSGHVVVHMGDGKQSINPILKAIDEFNVPVSILRPTHINRNRKLAVDCINYAKNGGYIDATAGIDDDISHEELVQMAIDENVMDRLTYSSDGYGSWSNYDEFGNLIEIGYAKVDVLFETFKALSNKFGIEKVLPLFTSNLADSLKLNSKGYIKENKDADILVLDEDLTITDVIAKGEFAVKNKEIIKYGTYEDRNSLKK